MHDLKMQEQIAGVENAGPENAGSPVNALGYHLYVLCTIAISYLSNFGLLMDSGSPIMSDACDRQTDGH